MKNFCVNLDGKSSGDIIDKKGDEFTEAKKKRSLSQKLKEMKEDLEEVKEEEWKKGVEEEDIKKK